MRNESRRSETKRAPRRNAELRALVAATLLVASIGCAGKRFVVPTGAALPRPDGADLWGPLVARCQKIDAFGGQLKASGRVAGNRVPGLQLGVVLGSESRIALEARVSGTLFFGLRGSAGDATLLLYQEHRVVTGPVADLLDALVGIAVGPERLLAILAGCVSTAAATSADSVGNLVRVRTADGEVYLDQSDRGWRVRAGVFDHVVVDYDGGAGEWPTRVRIANEPNHSPDVQLALTVESADRNPRDASIFTARVPDDFERVTIQWVRENGPLSQSRR
jgi:hypothetical protein